MKKAVLFDFDGTLLNTLTSIAYCGNKALEMHSHAPLEVKTYAGFIGHGADSLVEKLYNHINTPSIDFASFKADYMELYHKYGTDNSEHYKNIPELLCALKKSGVKIAVLSNKPMEILIDCVKKYFDIIPDVVLGQQKGKPTKPDPTQLFEILEELGLTPEDCAFCGDSGVDIQTGINAGMLTIGAAWGFYLDTQFEKADRIAYDPLEILEYIK